MATNQSAFEVIYIDYTVHIIITHPTLWHSRVLHLWLVDLDGVVLQIEQDDTSAHSILLHSTLLNSLLKVRIETQYLSIQ